MKWYGWLGLVMTLIGTFSLRTYVRGSEEFITGIILLVIGLLLLADIPFRFFKKKEKTKK